MRRLVNQYKKDPNIRELSLSIVRPLSQKDWKGEIKAITRYVRDEIRYTRDIRGVETVATPLKTLEYEQGDCDDKSTLLAAMLESVGHPTRFVAIGNTPNQYQHVFVETRIGVRWLPLETTEDWEVGKGPEKFNTILRVHN